MGPHGEEVRKHRLEPSLSLLGDHAVELVFNACECRAHIGDLDFQTRGALAHIVVADDLAFQVIDPF